MNSSNAGDNTTDKAVVHNITDRGFYMTVDGEEFFLSFERYPWFDNAPVHAIFTVEFSNGFHLHWPALDVDLELDSLRHPEKYPLIFMPTPEYNQQRLEDGYQSLVRTQEEIMKRLRCLRNRLDGSAEDGPGVPA